MDVKNRFPFSARNVFRALSFFMVGTLAACASEELPGQSTGTDGSIRFTTSIGGSADTRASGDTWEAGDAIGVFMHGAGGAFDKGYYKANHRYVVEDNQESYKTVTFEPDGAANALYYPVSDAAEVYFTAYYPYTGNKGDFIDNRSTTDNTDDTIGSLSVDISTQTPQSAIDLLYVKKTDAYSKTSENAHLIGGLQFEHKLSKVVINIGLDNEMKDAGGASLIDPESLEVAIRNIPLTAEFQLADGSFTGLGSSSATSVSTHPTTPDVLYEAIIIPHGGSDASGREITFTFDTTDGATGAFIEYSIPPDKTFTSGKKTEYTFTLKRKAVVLSGATIQTWGSDGDAISTTVD